MKTTDDGFDQPHKVSDVELAFPANVARLMPSMASIPESFKDFYGDETSARWINFQSTWFFCGLPAGTNFVAKDGVDRDSAVRHLKAIQGSFEPSHEHKSAAVAWLASRWFERVEIPGGES